MSDDGTRLAPVTSVIHLEFNAGEDVSTQITVRDRLGVPVPLSDATAVIGLPHCQQVFHEWSTATGNLLLQDQATQPGVLHLISTREDTTGWVAVFGDAEWQLDVIDVFGRSKRACQGDVRINPTRRGTAP